MMVPSMIQAAGRLAASVVLRGAGLDRVDGSNRVQQNAPSLEPAPQSTAVASAGTFKSKARMRCSREP